MALQMEPGLVREIRAFPGNNYCVDCQDPNPQWASVSYGTLFCLECSGKHRGLGVHISFVRSITMDSWSEKQIQMMKRGGNEKFRSFMTERGVPNNMSISAKYQTPDADYYRRRHKAVIEGKEIPAMPPRNPIDTSVDYSRGDPNGKELLRGESEQEYIARQTILRNAAQERMKAKFGVGGMQGLGSDSGYNPGGNNYDDPTQQVVGALGNLWTGVRETVGGANEELKKAQLGQKVKQGWTTTVSATNRTLEAVADEESRKRLAENTAKGWDWTASTAKSLWGSVRENTTSIIRNLNEPDDDEPVSLTGNLNRSSGAMAGFGGGISDQPGQRGREQQPAPGRPPAAVGDEDPNGMERLTGESESEYVARQTRLRDEAKERMRAKFGGGGMKGVGSGSSGGFGSQSSLSSNRRSSSDPSYSQSPNPPQPPQQPSASVKSSPPTAKKEEDVDFFADFGM